MRFVFPVHDLLHLAERGLRISYWSFAAAFFVVAFGGEYLLPLIGKSVSYVSAFRQNGLPCRLQRKGKVRG